MKYNESHKYSAREIFKGENFCGSLGIVAEKTFPEMASLRTYRYSLFFLHQFLLNVEFVWMAQNTITVQITDDDSKRNASSMSRITNCVL
jgi:hypothetical protein